ncbi:hypothetical protein E2I00_010990, partial [Balaenoptera physalus]
GLPEAIGTNTRLLGGGSRTEAKNVSAKGLPEAIGTNTRLLGGGSRTEAKNVSAKVNWFLRAPKRKLMTVPGLPKKPCPCDHFKGRMKKTRHQRHHKKPTKPSRACQQFLRRCQLASFALPL